MPEAAPDRPIFVVGCPRSGTTLLQVMLHAHARIAIPPETRFIMDVYRRRARFGDLTVRANRRRLARYIVGRRPTRFHHLGLDNRAVVKEIVNGPPTVGSAIGIILRGYARRFDKPRWGDKRPSYYQDVAELRRMFPDAQFIHLVRDGRDAIASLKRMHWFKGDGATGVALWNESITYARHWQRVLPADTWYEVRYEDLVADPAAAMAGMMTFLGEELDPAQLRQQETAVTAVPEYKTWHDRTRQAVDATRIGTHKTGLTAEEIRLFNVVGGRKLRSYGYEVNDLGRPSAGELLHYERIALDRRWRQAKRHWEDSRQVRRQHERIAAELY